MRSVAAAMMVSAVVAVGILIVCGNQSTVLTMCVALVDGVHQMTDRIASTNAIEATAQGQWAIDIRVTDLNNVEQYAACLFYLENQSLVTSVDIMAAEPGLVQFHLRLNASPQYVTDVFNRGSVLLVIGEADSLEYRYLP